MANEGNEKKIFIASILGAGGLWILDAFVDSFIFREGLFWDSITAVGLSIHELYFRSLFVISFVLFGFVIYRVLIKRRRAEESLRRAAGEIADERTKSRSVLEAIADGISLQDQEFRILYQNEAHKRLVGEQYGRYCYEAYSHRDSRCPDCPVAKAFMDGRTYSVERSRNDGGETMFVEISASPLRNARGEIVAGIEAVRDITGRKRLEESLQEQKRFAESVIEYSAVATFVLGPDHKVLLWNKACEELTSFLASSMIGTDDHWKPFYRERRPTLADVLIDGTIDDLPKLYDSFSCSLLTASGLQAEGWYPNLNGKHRYVLFDANPIHNSRGELIVVIETLQDITERKRADEALKQSEEKYKNIIELSTDIIYRSDKNGNQVFMNDAAFKKLKYPPEEVIGKPMMNLIHPDDRQRTWEKRKEMIEQDIDVFNFENRYITKNGEAIPVLHNVRVLRNEKGEIIGTQGIARDITVLKQAQEKLRLFSEAIEEAMDGIQIVDLSGRIVYSNKAVEEIYGYTAAELLGKHVNDMNADPSFAGEVILPAVAEAGRWSGELVVKHRDGREFPIWLSASMVRNEKGTPIAMIGIIQDITERKKTEIELRAHREHLEELVRERTKELVVSNEHLEREFAARRRMEEELVRAQKLESLSLLAGGIAHDFNNLLASMLGNITLAMLDVSPAGPTYQQLSSAERAALRARELTMQLLTFSRGGAPVKSCASIGSLIRGTADFSLRGSRAKLAFSLPDDLWPVEVDQGQISQVTNNLIINADQAMPDGGTITITGENVVLGHGEVPPLGEGNYVRITVRDEGIGISQEYLSKIFDPYFTTKQKGSGLGLAVSYSIIQKHDGVITVESEAGKGASFSIYLPASPERRIESRPPDAKLFTGRGRILVMDDEEDVRQTTSDILTRLGYTVELAEDGDRALTLYQEAKTAGKPFDLAIMDLTVPGGMGGKEAVQRLLEIDPDAKAIVSSGYSKDSVMSEYANYGFKGVVMKPFRVRELSEAVHQVLNNHG